MGALACLLLAGLATGSTGCAPPREAAEMGSEAAEAAADAAPPADTEPGVPEGEAAAEEPWSESAAAPEPERDASEASSESSEPVAYESAPEESYETYDYLPQGDIPLEFPASPPAAAPASPGGPAAPPPPEAPPLVDKELRSVQVYYGTNRLRSEACPGTGSAAWDGAGECTPNAFYGGKPSLEGSGLEVGWLRVSFPGDHRIGRIERPPRIFSFALRAEDPEKDVLIAELRAWGRDYEGWAREVRATGRSQAFVYVHGYATAFDEAARRAAQVAYDLDFDLEEGFRGIPMVFSWPSRGETDAYLVDYDISIDAVEAFNEFLDVVKQRGGIERVHVIAHSMGNRLVANALAQRREVGEPPVDQLVLAAPDIFAATFRQRFLSRLPDLASRVTLYVSDNDRALRASAKIRKGEPRAGQVAGGLLEAGRAVDRFDAIDATTLESDFLGHSYYANNDSVLSDIYCLLKGFPPERRPLLMPAGAAWRFRAAFEIGDVDAAGCGLVALGEENGGRRWPWIVVAALMLLTALMLVWWRRAA